MTYIEGPGTRVRARRPIVRGRVRPDEGAETEKKLSEAAKFEEETEEFCFPVIHLHPECARTQTADSK